MLLILMSLFLHRHFFIDGNRIAISLLADASDETKIITVEAGMKRMTFIWFVNYYCRSWHETDDDIYLVC